MWTNRIVLHEINELTGEVRSYLRDQDQYAVIGHVDTDATGKTLDAVLYVLDTAGAIETAFNRSGQRVFEADRTIYGEYVVVKNDANITQRLCNQYQDEEVGLAYNLYRWYDSRLGLFVTTDPWLLRGNINPRDYSPNPLRWCDPIGLFPHPGVGTGVETTAFHPSPTNPMATIPSGVDGLTRDYLSNPGHWARDSNASPPRVCSLPGERT